MILMENLSTIKLYLFEYYNFNVCIWIDLKKL
jgi:hypothetical protein